jgi:anti-sigma-K factor RskA
VRPENPDLIDRLASEYVLGTLRGPARRRFESWRASVPLVDQRCRFWEDRLMHLAKSLKPLQPPAHVWQAIRDRLNLSDAPPARRWARALAVAASVVLIVGLAALLYWRSVPTIHATAVATLSTKSGAPVWSIEVLGATNRVVMRVETPPARQPGHDYELWALPAGGKPVSLGVMPVEGSRTRALTDIQKAALANSPQVAVTLEPSGGSPTGQPTSAVIFVAPLRTVS